MSNRIDSDEMTHYEPSHLDLHCLQRYIFLSAGSKGEMIHFQEREVTLSKVFAPERGSL